ncbi:MAG: DNA translocase FtsK [Candidatus Caldatribacterium sp.]|uniref:DNA translocase FtsK n=1 Tax=Candidatus Caldatribacterium sp. TaxID=2282143 RepID=UPI002993C5EF|nr:DNA translocase FtsK [Candidatus Caldatribacterium sp.]MCX7731119.1 DNA translocase FtsK [Candidatus Caldatribacterium sp.]MDW8081448.1 DNA translocase FtsK 4TM domain-containing protein [Candidatus Calescibacterium sp.]
METKRKFFVFSVLVLTTVYLFLALLSSQTGELGALLRRGVFAAFGLGAYLLPFLLGFLTYELATFLPAKRYRFAGRIIGIFLWFFVFLTLSEREASRRSTAFPTGRLGGAIGAFYLRILQEYLGETGMLLFLFFAALLGTYLISEGKLLRKITLQLHGLAQRLPEEPKPQTETEKPLPQQKEQRAEIAEVFTPSSLKEPSCEKTTHSFKTRPKRTSQAEKRSSWVLPSPKLLDPPPPKRGEKTRREIEEEIAKLEQTLAEFGVTGRVLHVQIGPTITRYEFQPAPGIKVNKIVSLSNDIALAFAAAAVRIEAPIPGKAAVGIEIPNRHKEIVTLRELLEMEEFVHHPSPLLLALGKDVGGKPIFWDLRDMPHLLIAGATGSGKSVCINALLGSLLYRTDPTRLRIVLVDPKRVELSLYAGIPHLCAPVVSEVRLAVRLLKWLCREMDTRYELLSELSCRNIEEYNSIVEDGEKLPYIVVVVDELADLMMTAPNDVETYICRLAQMARAVGIHLVVATQRPSVDVITGLIKANFPSRLAFAVSSQADSRTILDGPGAEKLLGNGDMLFAPLGVNKPIRGQGAFIRTEETRRIVEHWIKQKGTIPYPLEFAVPEETSPLQESDGDDELYEEAVRIVVETGKASTSLLQRRLRIGFNRAARLIERMEREGIVGPYEGSKPRKVIARRGEKSGEL